MKLRNKLILSCAALAAVATTAVSTTFAWYTSNTEVTAEGISGATQNSADTTLLISKTGKQQTWGAKVDLELTTENIVPVTKDENGVFHAWDPSTNAPASAEATKNSAYIQFDLYFKSGSTDNLNVIAKEFNLVNTTTSFPTKTVLTDTGLKGITDPTYTVDFFRALTITTDAVAATEGGSSASAASVASNAVVTHKVYDAQNYHDSTNSPDSLDGQGVTYNAHAYYNAVKSLSYAKAKTQPTAANFVEGTYYTKDEDSYTEATSYTAGVTYYTEDNGVYTKADISAFAANTTYYTKDSASYTEASTFTADTVYYVNEAIDETKTNTETTNRANLPKTATELGAWKLGETGAGSTTGLANVLKVTYTIYLDGWDQACFDACQGQTFTLSMVFTSTKVA